MKWDPPHKERKSFLANRIWHHQEGFKLRVVEDRESNQQLCEGVTDTVPELRAWGDVTRRDYKIIKWVVTSGTKSSWRGATSRISQGSIESSVLFNIFINDWDDRASLLMTQTWKEWLICQRVVLPFRRISEGWRNGQTGRNLIKFTRTSTKFSMWEENPHTPIHVGDHPAWKHLGKKAAGGPGRHKTGLEPEICCCSKEG